VLERVGFTGVLGSARGGGAGTKFFPTHIDDGKWHGDQNGTERWSQLILGAVSIALASLNTSE